MVIATEAWQSRRGGETAAMTEKGMLLEMAEKKLLNDIFNCELLGSRVHWLLWTRLVPHPLLLDYLGFHPTHAVSLRGTFGFYSKYELGLLTCQIA
jgi:hypothetical protein